MIDGVWDDELQCFWQNATLHPSKQAIVIQLSDDGCTDMSGCIAWGQRRLPDVVRIITTNAYEDVVYQRDTSGEWNASVWPRQKQERATC